MHLWTGVSHVRSRLLRLRVVTNGVNPISPTQRMLSRATYIPTSGRIYVFKMVDDKRLGRTALERPALLL